jgi:hypothetical protein
MQISAGGRNRGMAERRLHEVDRGAAVECVARVGVAHPVRRDLLFQACLLCRRVDDPSDLRGVEMPAAFAAGKDSIDRAAVTPDRHQLCPGLRLQQDRTGLAAFTEDGDLATFGSGHGIAPLQPAKFADADAGDIEQLQQHPVASFGRGVDEFGNFAFLEDALGEGIPVGPELDSGSDIERKIAGFLAEGEQRLDASKRPVLAGRFEASLLQRRRIHLDIGKRDPAEWLSDEF